VCAGRFADRIGHPLEAADVLVIDQIDALYRKAAVDDPGRYTLVDVGDMSLEDSAGAVEEIVNVLLDRQAAHVS
jgi:dTMP kinase